MLHEFDGLKNYNSSEKNYWSGSCTFLSRPIFVSSSASELVLPLYILLWLSYKVSSGSRFLWLLALPVFKKFSKDMLFTMWLKLILLWICTTATLLFPRETLIIGQDYRKICVFKIRHTSNDSHSLLKLHSTYFCYYPCHSRLLSDA